MLLLCNEAANRQARKNSSKKKADADGVQSKPLGLEYIADRYESSHDIPKRMIRSMLSLVAASAFPRSDSACWSRLDTDDPIFGYMVRTKQEGWLQGFITLTTFTTWHEDFQVCHTFIPAYSFTHEMF